MGLLSSLRAAPKSASIRTQLDQLTERRAAAEAKLVKTKETWRQAVLDGTDADKANARSAVKAGEYDLQELLMQGEALSQLLAETEQAEAEQAARDQWAADVKAMKDGWAQTEKLLAEYEKHSNALAGTLRALRRVYYDHYEIELRRTQEGRRLELLDAIATPALPGCARTGHRLWEIDALTRLPKIDGGTWATFEYGTP